MDEGTTSKTSEQIAQALDTMAALAAQAAGDGSRRRPAELEALTGRSVDGDMARPRDAPRNVEQYAGAFLRRVEIGEQAAGRGQGEAVPVGLVGQVQALADEAALGLERRIAARGAGPGRPVLALRAPVETELKKAGGQDFLGFGANRLVQLAQRDAGCTLGF